jgi:hypothetical protein
MHVSCVSPNTSHSHITQPPVSQPLRHYLVIPVMFLVFVCAQNLCGHHGSCLQSSFIHVVKKFCSPSSFADPESCNPRPNFGAAAIRQQYLSPQGPPSWTECKILDWTPKLLELITLWCWKQTHKRQKVLTRQFSLDQEGASMCLLLLSKQASTKWLAVAPPYIPDAVVLACHLGFV